MQVNLNTKNNVHTNFKARIPNTLGKRSADALAKEFLASGDKTKVNFASEYLNAIKQLKQNKKIKEVLISSTDAVYGPAVIYDGLQIPCCKWQESPLGKMLSNDNNDAFKIMDNIIDNTFKIKRIITRLENRG